MPPSDDVRHVWEYDRMPRSGEPYRQCSICMMVEVYYLDDLLAEEERDAE